MTSTIPTSPLPRRSSLKARFLAGAAFALMASVSLSSAVFAQNPLEQQAAFQDITKSPEERAKAIVSRMTLGEKAAQLTNDAPAIPRLNVREYNWWNEGLHGVAGIGHATVFPQAVGMAATFDEPLIHKMGDVVSTEFRALYLKNQHRFGGSAWFGGLTVWSPNINIFRDPRWGRGQETYGEDPYLTARMGVAYVKGLQGDDPTYYKTIATPKHYAVHSGPEATRHSDNYVPTPRDLEETYLPAFRATIVEGKAGSIMCAYNAISGQPACANEDLLITHLRKNWKFDGFVVSDCDAVGDIYYKTSHHYKKTPEEGVAVALQIGTDLICGNAIEADHLVSAVNKGILDEAVMDQALVRLFTARIQLGQFDPAHLVFPAITAADYDTPEHRDFSQEVAEKAMVLLKNDNNFLPLKAAPKTIAVIGPNADTTNSLVGNYNGEPSHPITVLDGIKQRFPDANVIYAPGSGLIDPVLFAVPDSAFCQDANCAQPGLKVTTFATSAMTGDPVSVATDTNAALKWDKLNRATGMRWEGYITAPETGEYKFRYVANGGYRIWIDDKSVVDSWRVDWRPSIATGAVTLEAGKRYPIRVESFQRTTSGDERLKWALPSDQGAAEAVAAAKSADVVIFVAGLTQEVEGEEMRVASPGFEGGERTSTDLPPAQQKVLEQVHAAGTPVVLVLINGSPLSVNWADEKVPAIIEAWYPGGSGGAAVARLIAGDYSPAGRLPLTFNRSVNDLPAFIDYNMKGRTYRYFDGEVLYPFGYGLSYTTFSYSPVKVSSKRIRGDQGLTVSVDVTNSGKVDSDEVVQMYLSHPDQKGGPIRSLARFDRVHLKAGETKTVTFTLDSRALSTVDDDGVRAVRKGKVNVWVGGGQPYSRPGLSALPGSEASFAISSDLVFDPEALKP